MFKKALFLTLGSAFSLASCNQGSTKTASDIPSACTYLDYTVIEDEMGKADILNLLGLATSQITKSYDPDHALFENNANSNEFWFYELDQNTWNGSVVVYFDAQEKVIEKNCGDIDDGF